MTVYFIRAGESGPVKIGTAEDASSRLRELQAGNHVELRIMRQIDGGRAEELAMHRHFERGRIRGEWFQFDPEMLTIQAPSLIARIKLMAGDVAAIIDEWPSPAAFSEATGAPIASVLKWRQRNSIPARWWSAVIAAAQEAGLHRVTHQRLADIAA